MKEDIYIALLYKSFNGEITTDEDEQLSSWLQQSTENEQIATSVKTAWEMGANFTTEVDVDLEKRFDLLQKRIEVDKQKTISIETAPKVRKLSTVWRAAAAIALLLVAGFLLRNQFGSSTNWNEVQSTAAKKDAILLADGTRVWLNEGSSFSYPDNFQKATRVVRLNGEAYFEVAKDAEHPFIIQSNSGEIKVLGTSFNVNDRSSNNQMVVQVMTGKVQVSIEKSNEKVILIQDEKSTYDKNTGTLKKVSDTSNNAISWKTNRLVFKDIKLSEVIKLLEKQYKVHIEVENKEMLNCTITNIIKDLEIQAVLENISSILEMKLTKQNNFSYELKAGVCKK